MEEFESYKAEQFESVMDEIKKAKKREEFTEILNKLTPEQKKEATPLINARIKELKKDANSK